MRREVQALEPAGLRSARSGIAFWVNACIAFFSSIACSGCESSAHLEVQTGPIPTLLEAGTSDPDNGEIVVDAGVLDADQLIALAQGILKRVDHIVVLSGRAEVELNTLTADLAAAEIWWAPEDAAEPSTELGAARLAIMDTILAGSGRTTELTIDEEGALALSQHLVGRSRRARLFVRAHLPASPPPAGRLSLVLDLSIRILGAVS